jgi:hypothetical protein
LPTSWACPCSCWWSFSILWLSTIPSRSKNEKSLQRHVTIGRSQNVNKRSISVTDRDCADMSRVSNSLPEGNVIITSVIPMNLKSAKPPVSESKHSSCCGQVYASHPQMSARSTLQQLISTPVNSTQHSKDYPHLSLLNAKSSSPENNRMAHPIGLVKKPSNRWDPQFSSEYQHQSAKIFWRNLQNSNNMDMDINYSQVHVFHGWFL